MAAQLHLSRSVSSGHHISTEHRLRRKHLLLNSDTNASSDIRPFLTFLSTEAQKSNSLKGKSSFSQQSFFDDFFQSLASEKRKT